MSLRRVIFFGFMGAVALWFSHPSIFVFPGIGIALSLYYLKEKRGIEIVRPCLAFLVWRASLGLFYWVNLRNIVNNATLYPALLAYWSKGFAPLPLKISQIKWYIYAFFEIFQRPLGMFAVGIFRALIPCWLFFNVSPKEKGIFSSDITHTCYSSCLRNS